MNDDPIPVKPGVNPLGVIRGVAYDLINHGTSYDDRRAGRRLLGALVALEQEKADVGKRAVKSA